MPYGEKSAYEAQAKLKRQSPAYKKSSGFKMKGSPFHNHERFADGTVIEHPYQSSAEVERLRRAHQTPKEYDTAMIRKLRKKLKLKS